MTFWPDASQCEHLQTHQWVLTVSDVTAGDQSVNVPLEVRRSNVMEQTVV